MRLWPSHLFVERAAITVFFRGLTMHIANVGDSRCIVGEEKNGRTLAFPLSNDHTPFRKDER